jgi:hypothetical protein
MNHPLNCQRLTAGYDITLGRVRKEVEHDAECSGFELPLCRGELLKQVMEGNARITSGSRAPAAFFFGSMDAPVVGFALLGVGYGSKGFNDFPELGSLHAGSQVRVIFLD